MAIDALKNLTGNVPDWLQRLSDLSNQIEQRQSELAALGEGASSARSLRNKGSNESLLRKDDDDDDPASPGTPPHADDAAYSQPQEAQPQTDNQAAPASPSGPATTSGELKQQTKTAMAVAQARARAQVRRRHRSQSICSIEGNPAAYRSRSMIIVYYDSYVEGFFEGLVKFVSASRNLMRKAKMAAKVAQIKRLAEVDQGAGNGDDDDDDSKVPVRPLPSLRYLSAARNSALRMSARGGMNGPSGDNDIYDQLDKGLEYVQSMCERAAHQFLRDGDCNEEISNIARRLSETKDLADKEAERILRDEPDLAQEPSEAQKVRMHRPPAVRRDLSGSKDATASLAALPDFKRVTGHAALVPSSAPSGVLMHDETLGDEGARPRGRPILAAIEPDTDEPSLPTSGVPALAPLA